MKLDKWFLFTLLGLFFVPPITGVVLYMFRQPELAVAFWVGTYFAHLAAANWLGSWQGKRDLITGAKAVIGAQEINDRWDVQKTAALAHFAREIYRFRPAAAEMPPMLLDGEWSEASVPELQEFRIKK